jgi:hypothetical protein
MHAQYRLSINPLRARFDYNDEKEMHINCQSLLNLLYILQLFLERGHTLPHYRAGLSTSTSGSSVRISGGKPSLPDTRVSFLLKCGGAEEVGGMRIGRVNRSTTLSTTNPTRLDPSSNPGRRGGKILRTFLQSSSRQILG